MLKTSSRRDESIHEQEVELTKFVTATHASSSIASGLKAGPDNVKFSIASRLRVWISLALAFTDCIAVSCFAKLSHLDFDTAEFVCLQAAILVAAQGFGFYALRSSSDLKRLAVAALATGILVMLIVSTVSWGWVGYDRATRVAYAMLGAVLVAVSCRLAADQVVRTRREHFIERVAVAGTEQALADFARASRVHDDRVSIAGWLSIGDQQPGKQIPLWSLQLGADCQASPEAMPRDIDRILVLRAGLGDGMLDEVANLLEATSLPVHVINISSRAIAEECMRTSAGWVLLERPISHGSMLLKRTIDVAVATFMFVLISPIILLVALAIRLETPGPVLFRQDRLGRGNVPFTVLKFRTMRADAAGADGSVQAVRGDLRVTRVGAFLRKTSIDELPQLINVLQGTMSLVGPRPHPTELNRRFVPLIENYSARHRMAPGITGWAQVNGLRGETRTLEQMRRRVELDLEYIRGHSLAFDFWIMLRTVFSVLRRRNVY